MTRHRVLFFPEQPSPRAVIARICGALGCAVVHDPGAGCDLAIAWDTNTYRRPVPELARLAGRIDVWNLRCRDIGKPRVDQVFRNTFRYSSLVDPACHRGVCVAKSPLNGAHDGTVIEAPVEAPDGSRVYQRLICNELADGTVEDIRTPIFGDHIPFVYLQYRPMASRFDQFDTHARIETAGTVFTARERRRLARFAGALGLDYGELDVLRDRHNGRLYVVDANPTPFGPPNQLSGSEQDTAVAMLADAFERLHRRRGGSGRSVRRSPVCRSSKRRGRVERTSSFDDTIVSASHVPELAVVVVARNEGDYLRTTVTRLAATLAPPNEIIVVDDGSDDGSATGLSEIDPRVQVIRAEGIGVAAGRNRGAWRATARVIVFADAHLSIPDGWARPLLAALTDPAVGGAAPAITSLEQPWKCGFGLRFTGFDLDVEWLPRLGDQPYAVPLMPWCFGAMRRDVFEATGGFDTGMIQWGSIDNEMSVRLWSLGYELKIVPDVAVAHLFRDTRPYPIEWLPVVHNRLRLAFAHFEEARAADVLRALASYPEFEAGIARVVNGDIAARRRELASRRVRDTGWLFQTFEQESGACLTPR